MHLPHELAPGLLQAVVPDAASGPPPLPALDNTYGALFLGTTFGLMLYGLTVHQTYRYYRLYQADIALLKWLVAIICIIETFHTVLVIVSCYHRLITNFFRPETIAAGHWATRLLTPTTGATIFVCQSFYARRVWLVGPRHRFIVAVSVLFMFTMLAFTLSATVEGFILSLSDFRHVSWMVSAFFGCAVLVDILLTSTLISVLLRSRTGFESTDSTIEALIIYTINTGLLTSIFGLLCFIFAIILPGNFIYIGISIVGTKLYANSVLAVLNTRRSLSNRLLEGFEMNTFENRSTLQQPRGELETWDAPQRPRRTDTHISFAVPSNVMSLDSTTAGGSSGEDTLDKDVQKSPPLPRLEGRGVFTI